MKRLSLLLVLLLSIFSLEIVPSSATARAITLSLAQTPGVTEPIVTLFGTVKPAKAGTKVVIQISLNGKWQDTRFTTTTARVGTWRVVAAATAPDATVSYRAKAQVGNKTLISPAKSITLKPISQIDETNPLALIDQSGPGGRIHGADISRWQHPNDQAIDFTKMYSSGVRFVMIKSSDTRDEADALALKYLVMDRSAAQAAGIFTGFYHYTVLPDVSTNAEIIEDAQTQAQKVVWRLASLGGYTERDLPYALDLENNCVRLSGSSCARYAPKAMVTLWAKTFLSFVKEKTSRTPIIYSYPSFLEGAMVQDPQLREYPLWLAQYAIDPADPLAQPGLKIGGCYVHSWTASNCSSQWTVWQYTSCGIAPKYGVPGTRLDLNIFRGTPNAFLDLIKGSWVPEPADLMPRNESTTISIKSIKFSDASKPITAEVDVFRPDTKPVVTGTVRFYQSAETPMANKLVQTVIRSSSGSWKLTIKGVLAGTWKGHIGFVDATGTHASIRTPVEFTVGEAAPVTPTPSAVPSPSPTKKPVTDGCRNQIKN